MTRPAMKRTRTALWLLVALAAGVGLYLVTDSRDGGDPSPQTHFASSIGGPFTLTAADGSTFTEKTLSGKPYAIFFGFTRCPDVCPTSLNRLAKLRGRMGADGDKFDIVFVSVDPGYDSPEDVGRYVDLFGTPIIGLTGTDAQVAAAAKAYGVYYEKIAVEGGDYTVDHTAAVFLMDRAGKLQSIIDFHEQEDTSLAKLERLVS